MSIIFERILFPWQHQMFTEDTSFRDRKPEVCRVNKALQKNAGQPHKSVDSTRC